MNIQWIVGGIIVIVALAVLVWFFWPRMLIAPTNPSEPADVADEVPDVDSMSTPPPAQTKQVRAQEIKGTDDAFTFTAIIPANWQVESVAGLQAVSLYDPQAQGDTSLDQSQIFIRSFSASDFLTLTTVNIHSREELTINDRPAVRYDIEKKASVADFPSQPAWRSLRHIVTDIRVSDDNPSVFYVIAKRPNLDMETYEAFLQSLIVDNTVAPAATPTPTQSTQSSGLVAPVDEFESRITKKPFGIHITPETSPVQPEKFSGYHTGADAEYEDFSGDVPVRAVADGTILLARTSSGYGGVVAIQHTIDGQQVVSIYGHLRPSSLPKVGAKVVAGQQIGVLGTGGTSETDGERKHLHFGLVKGTIVDLRGYVSKESELSNWLNPVDSI